MSRPEIRPRKDDRAEVAVGGGTGRSTEQGNDNCRHKDLCDTHRPSVRDQEGDPRLRDEIPFYYSLAKTFPLCDRYFCSVLAQTYPNRRFLLSGTAFGLIATDTSSVTGVPQNGTIFDRLDAHNISWASYATNVSTLYVISDIVKKNPSRMKSIDQFHADAKSGSLPSVSYVDPNILSGT